MQAQLRYDFCLSTFRTTCLCWFICVSYNWDKKLQKEEQTAQEKSRKWTLSLDISFKLLFKSLKSNSGAQLLSQHAVNITLSCQLNNLDEDHAIWLKIQQVSCNCLIIWNCFNLLFLKPEKKNYYLMKTLWQILKIQKKACKQPTGNNGCITTEF